MSQLYHLLTGEYLKQCDINHAEQEINQLTSDFYCNLLVIIDDVWHFEDAEPLVKAFSNCKTILTTRMSDIEQYIPSKQSVTIGPMMEDEAISLLISGVIDSSQLSQEDVSLLNEISQDVHLWPLLLSLIRGQLSHNLKQYHLSYHKAIENVQVKLHQKGLTAFDKNNFETVKKSRKLAVTACIEVTLELLTKSLSDRLKTLILWTGIGTSLQTTVLNNLWNTSIREAEDTVNVLWAYGIVQFNDVIISSFTKNMKQHFVEVHAVVSQYISECMDSEEAYDLSPYGGLNTYNSVNEGLTLTFQQSYGVHDLSSLTAMGYMKYKLYEIENDLLPHNLKMINMRTITDPHDIIRKLQGMKTILMTSPSTRNLLSLLDEETITDCKQILQNAHNLCRKLNQSVQRDLYEKNYDKLIKTVEKFIKNYPLCNIAKNVVTMMNKMIPLCDGKLLHYMIMTCEHFQMLTHDYHPLTTLALPYIRIHVKLHKLITSSFQNGSPDYELTLQYMMSGKYNEEIDLVEFNHFIKLQEVAPNIHRQTLQQ